MPVLTKINTNVIADNAVTAAKLPAGAVDADIGVGSVTASHIAANAVGSSEIADDAVLPAKIAYLGDGSGNLSGTITNEQLRFGTTFTLDDDLTINGDVTLAKVGDDSTGQTLTHTASTARTFTGTGTLRMGSSLSSVDGMTGLNAVTGSILQVKTIQTGQEYSTAVTSTGASAYELTALTMTITVAATSSILITGSLCLGHRHSFTGRCYITYNHSGISETVIKSNINSYSSTFQFSMGGSEVAVQQAPSAVNLMFSPATANELTIKTRIMTSNSSEISYLNRSYENSTNANDGGQSISSLTFWEIGNVITPILTNDAHIDT